MALPWLKAPLGRWGSSCAVGGQRAGGGTRPYKETASGAFPSGYMVPPLQEVRNLPPHPSGLAASHLPPPGGRPRRRRIRTAAVSSANPGAQMEPHQRQFLQGQGPVAQEESRRPFPFFAPEILLNFSGVRPP